MKKFPNLLFTIEVENKFVFNLCFYCNFRVADEELKKITGLF